MLTLEQTAIVTAERQLTIEVPAIVSPGEHRVTVVIDTPSTPEERRRLNLIPLYLNTPPGFNCRREELYGDNGRYRRLFLDTNVLVYTADVNSPLQPTAHAVLVQTLKDGV